MVFLVVTVFFVMVLLVKSSSHPFFESSSMMALKFGTSAWKWAFLENHSDGSNSSGMGVVLFDFTIKQRWTPSVPATMFGVEFSSLLWWVVNTIFLFCSEMPKMSLSNFSIDFTLFVPVLRVVSMF